MTRSLDGRPGVVIRSATAADEPFLRAMLYYAANMAEDGVASADAIKDHAYLAAYVQGWGRAGDLGVVAEAPDRHTPLGAAWLRVMEGVHKHYRAVADSVPELAIAIQPALSGQGLGTQLLIALLDAAQGRYPAIILSVRAANPARRLYERHGFVVIDTITNRVGGTSYVMLIDLARRS